MHRSDLGAKHKSLLFPRRSVQPWVWALQPFPGKAWACLFRVVVFGGSLASEVVPGLSWILFLLEEGFKAKRKKKEPQEMWMSTGLDGVIPGQWAPGAGRLSSMS